MTLHKFKAALRFSDVHLYASETAVTGRTLRLEHFNAALWEANGMDWARGDDLDVTRALSGPQKYLTPDQLAASGSTLGAMLAAVESAIGNVVPVELADVDALLKFALSQNDGTSHYAMETVTQADGTSVSAFGRVLVADDMYTVSNGWDASVFGYDGTLGWQVAMSQDSDFGTTYQMNISAPSGTFGDINAVGFGFMGAMNQYLAGFAPNAGDNLSWSDDGTWAQLGAYFQQ